MRDEDEGPAEGHAVHVAAQLRHRAVGFQVRALPVMRVWGRAVVEQHAEAGFVEDFYQRQPGAHAAVVAAVEADDEGDVGDGGVGRGEEVDAGVLSAFHFGLFFAVLRGVAVVALVGVAGVEFRAVGWFFGVGVEEGFFHFFDGGFDGVFVGRFDGLEVDAGFA